MKKPLVIGIVAPMKAGKTTTTNMLSEFVECKESAFADKLKNASAVAFDIERKHFDDQNLKEVPFETPMIFTKERIEKILSFYVPNPSDINYQHLVGKELVSPRHIAQIVGTELLRDCVARDVHIIHVPIHANVVTVISDTRFENEYEVMKAREDIEYHPVYVYRKEAEEIARQSKHISETEFLKFKDKCYQLDNNGDLRDLELNVKKFIDGVLQSRE